MKTVLLTGSSKFVYQEPRRILTYMAAIIRRHRFVILAIICIIILIMYRWYFRREEKFALNNTPVLYVKETFNGEIFDSNKLYFSDMIKITNNIEEEQTQSLTLSDDEEISLFFSKMSKDDSTWHKTEELVYFIPMHETEEFIAEVTGEIDDESTLFVRDEENYADSKEPHLETKIVSSSMNGLEAFRKHKGFDKSQFSVHHGEKLVTLSTIKELAEGFPPPDLENKRPKTEHVTLSMSSKKNDTMDILNINNHTILKQQVNSSIKPNTSSTDDNPVLLIDTPGCKIPKLDPWDPTVRDLIELKDPYVCPGRPVFMESNPGGLVTFNRDILKMYYDATPKEFICYYQPIYRKEEEEGVFLEDSFKFGDVAKLKPGVPIKEDFINVSCNIKGKKYEQHLTLVPLKEDVEKERNSRNPPNPMLNIILLGIDSISKLNFLRHFPRTHAFLDKKLKPFEMNGYTKVADNTFPNLVPLLTGQFVEHWWNETLKETMFFDNISLIWKEYAKRGYRTFYAEDSPFTGAFNYFKRGFYDAPTDYYYRPLALALERWKFTSKQTRHFCLNSEFELDFIYNYLKLFAQTMVGRPYFGFAMVSTVTHDELNYASYADEPTERLLEGLYSTGALNNTLLVLFSDHGIRYGKICRTYVGKFEERLPLMYIYAPKWFLDQYPEIAKNLQTNQDRLMTLFDVHATMLHILDLNKSHLERSMFTLGQSLFEEISPDRTCPGAHIETHWCPCQIFNIVALTSPEVINASQAIVDDINSKLQPYDGKCEILKVDTIMDARVGKANELLLQYLKTENDVIDRIIWLGEEVPSLDDYMITLVAKPGGGVFVGTVRHNPMNNTYSVEGVNRISMYGNTSWCINSQKMKLFCYCKIQQLT